MGGGSPHLLVGEGGRWKGKGEERERGGRGEGEGRERRGRGEGEERKRRGRRGTREKEGRKTKKQNVV